MTVDTRIHVGHALPPLRVEELAVIRSCAANPLPRLGRILCVLAAFALPAFGIAAADTVHRVGGARASQAAAPVNPSDGAAAPARAVTPPTRALRAARTAVRTTGWMEIRT